MMYLILTFIVFILVQGIIIYMMWKSPKAARIKELTKKIDAINTEMIQVRVDRQINTEELEEIHANIQKTIQEVIDIDDVNDKLKQSYRARG